MSVKSVGGKVVPEVGSENPASRSEVVDISATDSTPTGTPDGFFVGDGGVVVGRLLEDDTDGTWTLAAGIWPLRFKKITKIGTDAEQMKYLFGGR